MPESQALEAHVPADQQELVSMAADFAALPCKVLWRLTKKEVPDAAALKALNLSTSVQVSIL